MSPALDKPLIKGCPPEQGWSRLNNDPEQLLGVLRLILQSSPTSKPSLSLTASQKNLLGMHQKQFAAQCLC